MSLVFDKDWHGELLPPAVIKIKLHFFKVWPFSLFLFVIMYIFGYSFFIVWMYKCFLYILIKTKYSEFLLVVIVVFSSLNLPLKFGTLASCIYLSHTSHFFTACTICNVRWHRNDTLQIFVHGLHTFTCIMGSQEKKNRWSNPNRSMSQSWLKSSQDHLT